MKINEMILSEKIVTQRDELLVFSAVDQAQKAGNIVSGCLIFVDDISHFEFGFHGDQLKLIQTNERRLLLFRRIASAACVAVISEPIVIDVNGMTEVLREGSM